MQIDPRDALQTTEHTRQSGPAPKTPDLESPQTHAGILLAERYNGVVTSLALDATAQRAYARCAADLRRIFGDRFVALVAGGPDASAAFASSITSSDLDAMSSLAESWHHDGLATPLVMTPSEFHRSLDTFPAEYQALIDHHVVIDGVSPLTGAAVHDADLRRACEAQARGHLIHLRQGWINAGAHRHGLADLIAQSAGPLRQLLTNLARLHDARPADDTALAAFAAQHTGMPEALVARILALEGAPHHKRALVSEMPAYLNACEQLWGFIDAWRAR